MNANETAKRFGIEVRGSKRNTDGTEDTSMVATRICAPEDIAFMRLSLFCALAGIVPSTIEIGAAFVWAFFTSEAFTAVNVVLPPMPEATKSPARIAAESDSLKN
jgi:hypothetical protein